MGRAVFGAQTLAAELHGLAPAVRVGARYFDGRLVGDYFWTAQPVHGAAGPSTLRRRDRSAAALRAAAGQPQGAAVRGGARLSALPGFGAAARRVSAGCPARVVR